MELLAELLESGGSLKVLGELLGSIRVGEILVSLLEGERRGEDVIMSKGSRAVGGMVGVASYIAPPTRPLTHSDLMV